MNLSSITVTKAGLSACHPSFMLESIFYALYTALPHPIGPLSSLAYPTTAGSWLVLE